MGQLPHRSSLRLALCAIAVLVAAADRTSGQAVRPLARAIEVVGGRRAAAGEVLVKFRNGLPPAAVQALGVDAAEPLGGGGGLHRLHARQASVSTLMASLSRRPDVEYVEPNYLAHVDAIPSDPLFDAQAGLLNQERPGSDIHAAGAWDLGTGTRANVVALLDTGVDYRHPDLAGNLWAAPAPFTVTIAGQVIHCPAGAIGFNAVQLTCDPLDDHGHGTAMAGIIGAVGNNGTGVSGVNWTASLMPLKFMQSDGVGSYADAINAIEFAVQVRQIFASGGGAQIRVLSNSWTGDAFSQALLEALQRANAQDMLVVAAAGNNGKDNDAQPSYPAGFDAPNVVSVMATGVDDSREPYSNFGQTTVDVGAPGLTFTTTLGGGYGATAGTSVAAAMVSGTAALVASQCAVSAGVLRSTLLQTGDLVEALRWVTASGERVNARRAVEACRGGNSVPAVDIVSPAHLAAIPVFEAVTIVADAYDSDGTITTVDFYLGNQWLGRDPASPFQLSLAPLPAGDYVLTAVATDDRGATSMTRPVTLLVRSQTSVPSPWQFDDVGAVAGPGHATAADGRFVVQGSGGDVWGSLDAFSYLHQPLTGDGEMTIRVTGIENVEPWTKAGIMIRESLAPDSAHAFILASAGKGIAFQRRTAHGSLTTHTAGPAAGVPYWLRIARSGSTITASASADGVTWTVVGSDVISWPSVLQIGLAVTSHATDRLALGEFDSMTLRSSAPAPPNPAAPPPGLPAGWTAADIGVTGLAGGASGDGTSFRITGAGADVWGTADAFQFVYRTLRGDGQIVARVTSIAGEEPWTKAGVMMRDTLDPGSAHAFMLASSAKGTAFQRRVQAQASSTHTPGGPASSPVWLRLVRSGQTIVASTSADGTGWSEVGRDVFAMGDTVMVGLAVSSHDAARLAAATFDSINVSAGAAAPLPAGWSAADVGAVGAAGSAAAAGSIFAVAGAGADVWGTADAFHFAYTELPGDGSITARVDSIDPVQAWTKAGVMIRQSLDPSSAHAFMLVSPGKGLAFQRRIDQAGLTTHTSGGSGTAPHWVRLRRNGALIVASVSADGITWSDVAADTLSISGTVYAGLAVSSHDTSTVAAATFTDVRVGP